MPNKSPYASEIGAVYGYSFMFHYLRIAAIMVLLDQNPTRINTISHKQARRASRRQEQVQIQASLHQG